MNSASSFRAGFEGGGLPLYACCGLSASRRLPLPGRDPRTTSRVPWAPTAPSLQRSQHQVRSIGRIAPMSWLRKPTFAQRGGSGIWSIPQMDDDRATPDFIRWTEMPWELDGRNGTAKIGLTKQEGFALMRDRTRRLLVFHAVRNQTYDHLSSPPPPAEEFVIAEEAFESASN
jgi:hypothetical protein